MILSSTPPGNGSVGEIFLSKMLELLPKEKYSCFALTSSSYSTQVESLSSCPIPGELAVLPREYPYNFRLQQAAGLSRFVYRTYQRGLLDELVRKAVNFGRAQQVELVWAVLNSPALIWVCRKVCQQLGVPYVGLVWDPPESLALGCGLDGQLKKELLDEFGAIIGQAEALAVASEDMQAHYRRLYGRESVVLIRPLSPAPVTAGRPEQDKILIGLAGSIYAEQEFRALCRALAGQKWQLDGTPVQIRLLSRQLTFDSKGLALNVEFLGWHSLEETKLLLGQCHLAYLPYWFDQRYEASVRLCFPDKLVSYIDARVPIFYHGPPDSSIMTFLNKHPNIGVGCHSLEEDAITARLRSVVSQSDFRLQALSAMEQAVALDLAPAVMQERLRRFLSG